MVGRAGQLEPRGSGQMPRISEREAISHWCERAAASPSGGPPIATVVIPVFNHLDETLRCLHAIATTWFETLPVEIVVVDDASTDRSPEILADLPGIAYLRNHENAGFVRSCNAGARHARGRYLCFLNNDTVVHKGWLDHLVATAERDARIGAVGAKLLYPNGRLQEAGGIIWRDGSGCNYGRNADPADARYNYERDVDYCSGAALLVRKHLFEELGGFSEAFAPAYYEDADLCFAIREAGYRVIYQPKAEVVHIEGATSGTQLDSGVKRYQRINRPKFEEKWHSQLALHYANDPKNVTLAARRLISSPRTLT